MRKVLGHMPSDPVAVSKLFKARESWTREPAWWFDLPIRKVKSNRQGVYYLLGEARKSSFVVLEVPSEFLMRNLGKFDTRYRDNIRLHIAAEGVNRFVDERVKSGVDFSRFELRHPKDRRD